jgi:hypothetical protein
VNETLDRLPSPVHGTLIPDLVESNQAKFSWIIVVPAYCGAIAQQTNSLIGGPLPKGQRHFLGRNADLNAFDA